ncbi:MAG: hypothetical protein II414_05945, partial [Erysipelotrichaceae bacterium]|nr:hypothetical protein [Erysipelotrichaceae bacterium]
ARLARAVIARGGNIIPMLPFMDEDDIEDLPEEAFEDGNLSKAILPFCNEETVARAFYKAMDRNEPLAPYMPFMDDDDINEGFVEMVRRGINEKACYPFVDDDGWHRVLKLYMEGEVEFDFDDAYRFMDDDDIKTLFRFEMRRRKEGREI